jgi:opacity protein-like surface antigen
MRKMIRFAAVAALFLGLGSTAYAAEDDFSLNGFFAGPELGGDFGSLSGVPQGTVGKPNLLGGFAGGEIGYQTLVAGNLVFGLNADIGITSLSGDKTSPCVPSVCLFMKNEVSKARESGEGDLLAEVGYRLGEGSMAYLNVGVTCARGSWNLPVSNAPFFSYDKGHSSACGMTFGPGFEQSISNSFSVRAEFRFTHLQWNALSAQNMDLNQEGLRVALVWHI